MTFGKIDRAAVAALPGIARIRTLTDHGRRVVAVVGGATEAVQLRRRVDGLLGMGLSERLVILSRQDLSASALATALRARPKHAWVDAATGETISSYRPESPR